MRGMQGLRIASYYWPALTGPDACGVFQPASRPRGTVVILHGHGAYLLELLKAQVRLVLSTLPRPGLAPTTHLVPLQLSEFSLLCLTVLRGRDGRLCTKAHGYSS